MEMYQSLDAHKDRTGIGGRALYKHMQSNNLLKPEHNITIQRIESWFARIAKMTVAEDFQAVITAYESINDAEKSSIIPRCEAQRVLVDDELLEQLNQIFAIRPNFSRKRFLLRNNAPTGLTDTKIANILSGKVNTIPVAHMEFFDQLISFYEN